MGILGRLRLLMIDWPRGAGRLGVTAVEGEEGAEPDDDSVGLGRLSPGTEIGDGVESSLLTTLASGTNRRWLLRTRGYGPDE